MYTKENYLLKPLSTVTNVHHSSNVSSSTQIPQTTHTNVIEQHQQRQQQQPPPTELLNFIEKQEGYIEQLERESQFCRVYKKLKLKFINNSN